MWRHMPEHIKPEKILRCQHCAFVTDLKHHFEYHENNHSKQKPYKCDKCGYACVNKSMLTSHMKSHSNVRAFRCSICPFATKHRHKLTNHEKKHGLFRPPGGKRNGAASAAIGRRVAPQRMSALEAARGAVSASDGSHLDAAGFVNDTASSSVTCEFAPTFIDRTDEKGDEGDTKAQNWWQWRAASVLAAVARTSASVLWFAPSPVLGEKAPAAAAATRTTSVHQASLAQLPLRLRCRRPRRLACPCLYVAFLHIQRLSRCCTRQPSSAKSELREEVCRIQRRLPQQLWQRPR